MYEWLDNYDVDYHDMELEILYIIQSSKGSLYRDNYSFR